MRRRLMTLFAGVVAVTALAFGGATLASAGGKPSQPKPAAAAPVQQKSAATDGDNIQQGDQAAPDTGAAATESSSENPEATAPDGDVAAQNAACTAAGIDPSATNVQYDAQAGCSLDNGANSGN